jgi:hypothetical protein
MVVEYRRQRGQKPENTKGSGSGLFPKDRKKRRAEHEPADPKKNTWIKQADAWVEYIKGAEVNRPNQLPQILPNQRNGGENGWVRRQIPGKYVRSKIA